MSSKIYVDELHPKTSGKVVDSKPVVYKSYASSTTSVTTGTYATVDLDTAVFDSHGFHDVLNGRAVIPTGLGGYYRITGKARTDGWISGRMILHIHVNGSDKDFVENCSDANQTTRYHTLEINTIYKLNDGDTITLRAYQNYGSTKAFRSGENDTNMLLERIGGLD